jgi:hypothetical protein
LCYDHRLRLLWERAIDAEEEVTPPPPATNNDGDDDDNSDGDVDEHNNNGKVDKGDVVDTSSVDGVVDRISAETASSSSSSSSSKSSPSQRSRHRRRDTQYLGEIGILITPHW